MSILIPGAMRTTPPKDRLTPLQRTAWIAGLEYNSWRYAIRHMHTYGPTTPATKGNPGYRTCPCGHTQYQSGYSLTQFTNEEDMP